MEEDTLYKIHPNNFGKCYTLYIDFIENNYPEALPYFTYGNSLSNPSARYLILKEAPHHNFQTPLAIIQQTNTKNVFIVERNILIEE